MKYGNLILEKKDFVMIKRYQHLNNYIEDYAHKDALETLEVNMSNALIYDLEDMPDDVVRLYSTITVSSESGWRESFQLVLPYEDDTANERISVQSTLGAFVIGLSEGDRFKYGLPSSVMTLKIEKVEQAKDHFKEDFSKEICENVLPKHIKNTIPLNI